MPIFNIGDFVLLYVEKPKTKDSARFSGPWRIVSTVSDHVFVIEHLLSPRRKTVHVDKLVSQPHDLVQQTEGLSNHRFLDALKNS